MATETHLALPFAYLARGLGPREKHPTVIRIRDEILVSVVTVTDAEAPVTLSVEMKSADKKMTYRTWSGRTYAPIGFYDGAPALDDFLKNCSTPKPPRGTPYPPMPMPAGSADTVHPMHAHTLEEAEASILRGRRGAVRWTESNREECRGLAQRELADGLLIVDGQVWSSCSVMEPFWRIHDAAFRIPQVRLFIPEPGVRPDANQGFAIDRLDEAVAYARSCVRPGRSGEILTYGEAAIGPGFVRTRDDTVELAKDLLARVRFFTDMAGLHHPLANELKQYRLWTMSGNVLSHEAAVEVLKMGLEVVRNASPEFLESDVGRPFFVLAGRIRIEPIDFLEVEDSDALAAFSP